MNIALTPELEIWIQQKVDSGLYTSVSDVIREALNVFRDQEELQGKARETLLEQQREELRQMVQVGLDQTEAGEVRPFTRDVVDEICANARRKWEQLQSS